MRRLLKILLFPFLVVNILAALLLLCCAYSPLLPAEQVPLLSLVGLAFPWVLAVNLLFLVVWLIVYRRYMLVSFVACILCFPQIRAFSPINLGRQNPPEESIKLVSYNILSSNLTASTANRDNPLVTYLEGTGADIICLQEFPFSALKSKEGKAVLAEYPYRSYQVSDLSELDVCYLCCLSKYPILSAEKIDINSFGNGCSKYRILHGTDTLVIYNCHLQSNSLDADNKSTYEQILKNPKDSVKAESAKALVKKLRDAASERAKQTDIIVADMHKETSPYIVVCGDFNDSPISYVRHTFTRQLDDAYVTSGNGPGISYNRNKLYYRIDHILHSDALDAYACTVDRSTQISDHYPISCHLKKTK